MQDASYMLLLVGGHRADSRRAAFVKIDAADYDWARQYRWTLVKGRTTYYAKRAEPGGYRPRMHRDLLGLGPGDPHHGDHINGNGLDNRRANLRAATMAENGQNRRPRERPRGVTPWRGKWAAQGMLNRRHIHIGVFPTELEAARAASDWRRENMPFAVEDAA